jgi:cobalt-zinc-cadmium efflux system protein
MGESDRAGQRRALVGSLAANTVLLALELAGGLVFGSLALLADAAHLLADVTALAVALVAQRLLERPATLRHSFGLQRAEVLGAQVNGLMLVAVTGWIVWEAIQRIGHRADVDGAGMLTVAAIGLAVNIISAVVLARVRGHSLNMHGAFVHMVADAIGSVGAVAAGVAVIAWDATWVDAVASIGIAVLVLWAAWGLLRDTTHVLLEGTPRHLDPASVHEALEADPEVALVHHLHMWNLASDTPALSAHVVLDGEVTLHEAQTRGSRLKEMLAERFGIEHSTLELECHPCEEGPVHVERSRPPGAGGSADHDARHRR